MESYRILIIGDPCSPKRSSGEPDASPAQLKDPEYYDQLLDFSKSSDSFISIFSQSIRKLKTSSPSFQTDLIDLGIGAAGLTNDHSLEYDPEDLESSFQTLAEMGIDWFGAGRTLEEARNPYCVQLPARVGGGELQFRAFSQRSPRRGRNRDLYASDETAGYAPLSLSSVANARNRSTPLDSFHIALPNWGGNHGWRGTDQFELAHRFLNKDYDLVLGHGSHAMQEVHRKQQRWVVYGTGDAFPAATDPQKPQNEGIAPTHSFWAILEIHRSARKRWLTLKLYPISSKRRSARGSSGPVSEQEFSQVIAALAARPVRPWRFDNPAQATGTDHLGHFIALDLGEWPEGARPDRLAGPAEGGDPADWPLRSPSLEIEDKILGQQRHIGPAMLALGAKADGGSAQWLNKDLARIEAGGKHLLAYCYSVHESSLGAALVEDKVLTARVLENAGVPTPKTFVVKTAEEAVAAAKSVSGPVVVKPRDGIKSRGVSTGLLEEDEVREAFGFAHENGTQVILQPHIEMSAELRVMASPERAVAVNGRALPHVRGDGYSTIRQLIEDKNLQRTLNPSLQGRPIPIDALTRRDLERIGFSLESVPELGQEVIVRRVAGLSVGGDTVQSLEETDQSLKDTAVAAIAAIPGLDWGGVDLLIEKDTGKHYVIEINAKAAYGAALFPAYGQPRDVGAEAWKLRYAATASDPPSAATGVSKHDDALMIRDTPVKLASRRTSFRRLFRRSLERQGYVLIDENSLILHITSPDGRSSWATRDGLTIADRSVVQRVLRRHHWVARLLKLREVPLPRRRIIASANQLRRFVGRRKSDVFLAPLKATWKGPNVGALSSQDALQMTSLPQKMWVQSRPAGIRVRVLASREKPWLITAAADQRPLTDPEINSASRTAIQAVQAIPELRWAAVDLLFTTQGLSQENFPKALVEGLTTKPVYGNGEHVLTGDFDAFARWVVDSSSTSIG